MTVLRASRAPNSLNTGKPISTTAPLDYVRPSDWLTLTIPSSSEQKFVGLVAVFNQDSNYIALAATVSSGTYTVDWGDGTAPVTVTSNTTAQYNYSYSSLNSSTLSSRGYRQAIVTVTPTTSGATFSAFELNRRHSARSSSNTVAPWLDVAISAPNATSLRLGGFNTSGTQTVVLSMLEQATIVAHNTSNFTQMFRKCYKLQSVPIYNFSPVTNVNRMFLDCISLQTVPLYNTANVTSFQGWFVGCTSLVTVPLFNSAAVTDMSYMFNGASAIEYVPLFNTAAVTNMSNMFEFASSLKTIPLWNTANVTNMSVMFKDCVSLQSIPLINTAANTNMGNMFYNCRSLTNLPTLNTAAVTDMFGAFQQCYALTTLPQFNFSSVTRVSQLIQDAQSLRSVPELNLAKITSVGNNNINATSNVVNLGQIKLTNMRWSQDFSNCMMGATQLDEMYTALATLNPTVTNVSGSGTVVTYTVSDITAFVNNRTVTITGVDPVAYNLTNVTIGNVNTTNKTFTVTNAATGAYVSGGVVTIQDNKTITVTGNPGTTGDTPTIATNKGWTVTGS
jgi:surface protein